MSDTPLHAKGATLLLPHAQTVGPTLWRPNDTPVERSFGYASDWQHNQLLAALPLENRARLSAEAGVVQLRQGQLLHEAGAVLDWVYFPLTTLVSLSMPEDAEMFFEVATVGQDGVVGLPLLSGNYTRSRAVVHIPGKAVRVRAALLADEFSCQSRVRQLLLSYSQALVAELMQIALCSRHHSLEQQLARLILLRLYRQQCDVLSLTQESIAGLLGVRRESITGAAAKLQQTGCMRYARGRITVLDKSALESRACHCHQTIQGEFQRLMQPQTP